MIPAEFGWIQSIGKLNRLAPVMKRTMLNLLGALAVSLALNLQFSTAFAQLVTFTNPTPADSDNFGYSVAAVGADKVLIGAPFDSIGAVYAGAAYLFSTNGTLLTTYTNPTPVGYDNFGCSVAAVGADRVLIGALWGDEGATNVGAAYLFSTNGTLLTTFTNPTPAVGDRFGCSVAIVGTDRVLIGAYADDTGASDAGVAYLFSTNGALLTNFTNPTPANGDYFGASVAAVGADQVLIGTPWDYTNETWAGAAYLFSTNGGLLTTFTNPTPAAKPAFGDFFGCSVAAVGSDRVLIGAYADDTGAESAGVAYLFSTNGALLTTFTNPTPAVNDFFGKSVAAMGTDRVLIGANYDETGASRAGAAYLFSTNGALLATFANPAPAFGDGFGYSVAAVGADQVLIGSPYNDTGAEDAGAAYLFSAVPSLTICLTTTNTVAVSWPSPWTGWTLQENTNGVASVNWSNAPGVIQGDGTKKSLVVDYPTGERFYRLFKPGS